ncbi:MAG: HAMP domain-containing sensor histidine kinase [Ktedonobacteraceae bacterium]
MVRLRKEATRWQKKASSGIIILIGGTILATLLAYVMNRATMFSNPGLLYLPLIALLAYHWNWRYAVAAVILQLGCVYLIFISPAWTLKSLDEQEVVTLITLVAVTAFVLALVQMARQRRSVAERDLAHFAALYRVALANDRLYRAEQKQTLFSERQAHAKAERLKDEFISIATHELRNPMAVLKGFTHMLIVQSESGEGIPLDDWQKEALQDIDQATTRLVELTDDLLDVTRLQTGQLAFHQKPIDLVSLTRRSIARLQNTTERHHITLTTGEEPIISHIDQQRIEQVLTNIINNAIKYSPAGGAIKVTLRAFAQEQLVQLSVQDHGIGIPAEQQSRIFGRFMRADNARAYGIRGTGLGLFLCRELLERQNGRIWFESREGEGSTFSFSLPLINDRAKIDGSLTPASMTSTHLKPT